MEFKKKCIISLSGAIYLSSDIASCNSEDNLGHHTIIQQNALLHIGNYVIGPCMWSVIKNVMLMYGKRAQCIQRRLV